MLTLIHCVRRLRSRRARGLLSLAALIGLAGLAPTSWMVYLAAPGRFSAGVGRGGIEVWRMSTLRADWRCAWDTARTDAPWSRWWFRMPSGDSGWPLVIPMWPIAFMFVDAAVLMELRARRCPLGSACVACGYSRIGLAAAAPCPECGKP